MGRGSAARERKTRVGQLVLQGHSLGSAMREVGYSLSSSRSPTNAGINAEECVRLALEADGQSAVSTSLLRQRSRELLLDSLESADPNTAHLAHVARAAEVCDRLGRTGDEGSTRSPRNFADRLVWIQELMAELGRRQAEGNAETLPAAIPLPDADSVVLVTEGDES